MKSKLNLSRLAKVVALACAALFVFASASAAQPLSVSFPTVTFDSGGTTTYDAGTDSLTVVATTLAVRFNGVAPPCLFVLAPGTFTINVKVDDFGIVSGGEGDDLVIKGGTVNPPFFLSACAPGMAASFLSGTLVTGNVQAGFDYHNSPDRLELRFTVTGGTLATLGVSSFGVLLSLDGDPNRLSTFDGVFTSSFTGGALGSAGSFVAPMLPPPGPTVTVVGPNVIEALGPGGAPAAFTASATSFGGTPGDLVPTCNQVSGSVFPLGVTSVICSATDGFGQSASASLSITVQDTTPPTLIGGDIEVQATSHDGAAVPFAVTASDLVDGIGVAVTTCSRASGSVFPIGSTPVTCNHSDAAGNAALPLTFTVVVKVEPPAIGEGCFIVNFREITYFNGRAVITSSDAGIRASNGITGDFNPSLWPYKAIGGTGYTKSRGTLFRIYGFQPAEQIAGSQVPDADDPFTSYLVRKDELGFYIDLGGPARVILCPEQLHNFVLAGLKRNGHKGGSTLLPVAQRNVPGIMLTHNAQILKLPMRVKAQMDAAGLVHGDRGEIDYIGLQLQGNGNAQFREFVDVEVEFPEDSATDLAVHFAKGFHTATDTNFETFAGCSYVDYAPGNDAVRLRDVWGPNKSRRQGYNSWEACGTLEPLGTLYNQKQRANYVVPFNAIQILPTVNTNTDTLRMFYGEIRPVSEPNRRAKDLKTDWAEWDFFDR